MQFTRSIIPYYLFLLQAIIVSTMMALVIDFVFPLEIKSFSFIILSVVTLLSCLGKAFFYFGEGVYLTDDLAQFKYWNGYSMEEPFLNYDDIGTVTTNETIMGRIFGYGDITVDSTGTDSFVMKYISNIDLLSQELKRKTAVEDK